MPVADLGITEDEVADQYQYTKDVMTDADGNLKGLSWQGCPGTMIYRRDIAKEVFGTDDPAEVQKKVADWDTFKATAEELKEKGYQMTSTVNDSYRVFSNNVSTPWVVDGKIIRLMTTSRTGLICPRKWLTQVKLLHTNFGVMTGAKASSKTVTYLHTSDQHGSSTSL